MNDVAYRINTGLPVKEFGTIVVNNGGKSRSISDSGTFQFDNDITYTVPTEQPAGSGLVNRFDDITYYTA